MAGSFKHMRDGGIDCAASNLGDAIETIEELYYLVLATASEEQISEALDYFYKFERGEQRGSQEDTVFAVAYRATKFAMDHDRGEVE